MCWSRSGTGGFDALPAGAVVGTSSLRRQAQLRARRPDLEYIEFRGNVDTRLAKLGQGKADAIILAAAGLDRLQKTAAIRERFAPEVLCPAPGQGALAIECRAGDGAMQAALQPLEDPDTRHGHHRRAQVPGRPGRWMPGAHRRLLPPCRRRIIAARRRRLRGWPRR